MSSRLRRLRLSSPESASGRSVAASSRRGLVSPLVSPSSLSSCRLCRSLSSAFRCSRLLSLLDRGAVAVLRSLPSSLRRRSLLAPAGSTPASWRLKFRTSFISRLSSCSTLRSLSVFSLSSTFRITSSPGVYFVLDSSFSSSVFPLSGFAAKNISSNVVTVALCFVSRTGARHDGHVYGLVPAGMELGLLRAALNCQLNHSFRHAPQKVCRQSRSVSG